MKARIVKGNNLGTYEVEYKRFWIDIWKPVYANGLPFPWRGSYNEAVKLKNQIEK